MKPKDRSETFSFHRVRFMYTTNRTWRRIATAALVALFILMAVLIAILLWYFVFRTPDGGADGKQEDSSITSAPIDSPTTPGGGRSNPNVAQYNGCFPPDSLAITWADGPKSMDQLRLGDRVLDLDADGRCCRWTSIYAFSFYDDERRSIVEITTDLGQRLRTTPNHLIFRIDNNDDDRILDVEASEIRIGDRLRINNGSIARVIDVRSTMGVGARSPLTRSGSMLVDGVWVSCFGGKYLRGTVGHHVVHTYAMAPLRALATVVEIFELGKWREILLEPELYHLWYIKILKGISNLVT